MFYRNFTVYYVAKWCFTQTQGTRRFRSFTIQRMGEEGYLSQGNDHVMKGATADMNLAESFWQFLLLDEVTLWHNVIYLISGLFPLEWQLRFEGSPAWRKSRRIPVNTSKSISFQHQFSLTLQWRCSDCFYTACAYGNIWHSLVSCLVQLLCSSNSVLLEYFFFFSLMHWMFVTRINLLNE